MKEADICKNCKWYRKYTISNATGSCMIDPPVVLSTPNFPEGISIRPKVKTTDYCESFER